MSTIAPVAKLATLYNVNLTLTEDAVVKANSNNKSMGLARGTNAKGRKVTVQTYVTAGIAAIKGLKAGSQVRLYGTFKNITDAAGKTTGRVFSAMGISTPKVSAPVSE